MARVPQIDTALVVQARLLATVQAGIASLSQLQIELGQQLDGQLEIISLFPDLAGEHAQDTVDLLALGQLEFAQTVVQLNNNHWLYKDSGATGGLVMYDAAYLAAKISLDWDDVAIIAHRHQRFLQGRTEFVDQCAQTF